MIPRHAALALLGAAGVAGAAAFTAHARSPRVVAPAAVAFTAHPIDSGLTGGYQVIVADLNRDGKPDIIALASGLHELAWYENPGWQRHTLVSGIDAPINAAVADLDGDGIPEVALAHGFSTRYAESSGIVSILTHGADPKAPWSAREIDRLPTSHRLRFVDVDGSGRAVLVNLPLIGPKAQAPQYRDQVPLVMYRPGAWTREAITTADSGVVHGIFHAPWGDEIGESVLSASFTGVHRLRFDRGNWTRTMLLRGDPAAWPRSGASEIAVGHLRRELFLATIEPWHGNQVVVYRRVAGAWSRHVIDSTIVDGHTLVVGDFDGDGEDEIVVGERGGRRSVYVYRADNTATNTWTRQAVDDGHMAAAGCAVADLNSDRRPDVVCIGTATANLTWYENRK